MEKCIINQSEEIQGQNFLVCSKEIFSGYCVNNESVYLLPEKKRKIAETIIKKGYYSTIDEEYSNIEEFAETLKSATDNNDFLDLSDSSQVFLWHGCFDWQTVISDDIESENYYKYWDGNNFKIISVIEDILITFDEKTETNLNETYINGNYYFKEKFCHANSYKIISIDGQKTEEPLFLVEEYSQWQGNHKTGKIMTAEELKRYCEVENDNAH